MHFEMLASTHKRETHLRLFVYFLWIVFTASTMKPILMYEKHFTRCVNMTDMFNKRNIHEKIPLILLFSWVFNLMELPRLI